MRQVPPNAVEALVCVVASWALVFPFASVCNLPSAELALLEGASLSESILGTPRGVTLALASSFWASSAFSSHLVQPNTLTPASHVLLALILLPATLLHSSPPYGKSEAWLFPLAAASLLLYDGVFFHTSEDVDVCLLSAALKIAISCSLAAFLTKRNVLEQSEALGLCIAPLLLEAAADIPQRWSLPYEVFDAAVLSNPLWLLYWLGLVLLSVASGYVKQVASSHASLTRRKVFHVAALFALLPAIIFGNIEQLSVCLAGAVLVLVLVETLRAAELGPLGELTADIAKHFQDDRDTGPFIFSHFALLFGLAAPVWISKHAHLGPLAQAAGAIAVGAGDTAAAFVGRRCGRTAIPGTCKTFEGTAAFIMATVPPLMLVHLSPGAPPLQKLLSYAGARAVLMPALLEATVSSGWDNVVVPLYMCAALARV